MKRSIGAWQFFGFAITSLGGPILHFLYDWLDNSPFVAPFSSVNESTWEHMKLLFFPMFIYAIFQSFLFKDKDDFWCVKLRGTLLGITLIPIIFYTFNGVIGKSPDWINIGIFFISAAIAYIYETRKFNDRSFICQNQKSSFIGLCFVSLMFIVFTFFTHKIEVTMNSLSLMNRYSLGRTTLPLTTALQESISLFTLMRVSISVML